MIIAAAHNITLGFQAGAFPVPFSIRLELVLIVAVVRWYVLIGA